MLLRRNILGLARRNILGLLIAPGIARLGVMGRIIIVVARLRIICRIAGTAAPIGPVIAPVAVGVGRRRIRVIIAVTAMAMVAVPAMAMAIAASLMDERLSLAQT